MHAAIHQTRVFLSNLLGHIRRKNNASYQLCRSIELSAQLFILGGKSGLLDPFIPTHQNWIDFRGRGHYRFLLSTTSPLERRRLGVKFSEPRSTDGEPAPFHTPPPPLRQIRSWRRPRRRSRIPPRVFLIWGCCHRCGTAVPHVVAFGVRLLWSGSGSQKCDPY